MDYILIGKYLSGKYEEIDRSETKEGVNLLLKEYRVAFGSGWIFKIKKGV